MDFLNWDIIKIEIIKFIFLPVAGFLTGFVLFFWILKRGIDDKKVSVKFPLWLMVVVGALVFTTLYSFMNLLKYSSFHTLFLDHGVYENKIWKISEATSLFDMFIESIKGHFQPLLFFYGALYKIVGSYLILFSQAVIVASGVIPLYLFAKEKLKDNRVITILLVAYLFYPPVAFNSMVDFHPDHVYIPLALWAYFFAQKRRYTLAFLTIGIGGLAKEPLLLGAAFFGLYIVLEKKDYRAGIVGFLVFMSLLYIIVFMIQPALTPGMEGKNVLESETFGIGAITQWKVRKFLFLYFLFVPFIVLPFLGWRALIPALPLIGIPLLSHTYLHSSIHSQYTVGIIPSIFASVVCGFSKIQESDWKKYLIPTAVFVLTMIITFHIAHSPSPLSLSFWLKGASIKWDKSNYIFGEHERRLEEAIFLIKDDRSTKVVYQNDLNYAYLSNRYKFSVFPIDMDDADYILVDTTRYPFVGDKRDREEYNRHLMKLFNNTKFKLAYNRDGIKLFRR